MMPHRVLGVLFFTMMGAAIGYVLATAYLDWRLSMPVGYDFLVLRAKSLWATQPDLAEHAAFIVGGPALAAAMLGAFLITEKLSTFGTTHWQTPAEMKSGRLS